MFFPKPHTPCTSASLEGVPVAKYSYDANGNRVSETTAPNSGTPRTGSADAQDRLTQCGAREFSYGAGRRITKKVNGVYTHGFIYESQLRVAAQMDASGNITHEFIYGEKPNVPEAMILPANTGKNPSTQDKSYRLLHDHLGSVRMVIEVETGAIAQEIEYDAWGQVLNDSNPGFQPFGFAGGLYDSDTKLTRFGARDYDAQEGRWTTKDPKGLAGGLNLYQYANGDPVNFYDPTGEVFWIPIIVGGIGTGFTLWSAWSWFDKAGEAMDRGLEIGILRRERDGALQEADFQKFNELDDKVRALEAQGLKDAKDLTLDAQRQIYGDGTPGSGVPGGLGASRLPEKAKTGLDLFGLLKEACGF
ncbi:MAG: RHS repeat-associated core domain-containing protein [Betaproteobacteria bacterium]|nr:MAG: RHS repeat-associated core domain-containing protein [Betaproteobacteria bacterium]